MERQRYRWGIAFILICLIAAAESRGLKTNHGSSNPIYNHTLATTLVEYASAVYMSDLSELFTWTCSRCNDKTKGFEMIELIVDVENCLQAFVGVDQNLNSIIIAFRGTQKESIQNWIEDLFWKQLDLNYPGMPEAMVHHGFYSAYHNTTLRAGVLNAVKQAREIYGDVGVMVTGHSMGAAMASFCALDLMVNHNAEDVQVVTFGQPRVGNAAFAAYFSKYVPRTIRVTNSHDIVPHLPPYFTSFPQKTYHHFPREVWLYDIGFGSLVYRVEKICDRSGEDPSCSRSVSGNSVADHLTYFGVELHADGSDSCGIVMGPHEAEVQKDARGNLFMSKDARSLSLLRVNRQPHDRSNSASDSLWSKLLRTSMWNWI